MIRIMQLSDLHFQYDRKDDIRTFIIPALNKDIEEFNKTKEIDLFVITGDLIDKGGLNFPKDSDPFKIFEEEFIEKLNIDKEKIVFVPGNHDVKREEDEDFIEMGIKYKLNTIEAVNDFIKNKENADEITGIKRIKTFKDFERRYHEKNPNKKNISNFHSNFIFDIDSKKVAVTCFNSAWRCYDSDKDKGNILLGERQITESRKYLSDCDLKIALMHHSVDYFVAFEEKYLNSFLEKDYNLLLCGHTHKGSNNNINSGNGGLIQTVAPANWSYNIRTDSKDFSNGYLLIDYGLSTENVSIHHRRYSYAKGEFVKNTDKGNTDGIETFKILNNTEKQNCIEEEIIAKKIIEAHSDIRNSHLLSYNTDSTAPKDLESIFVMPRIVKKKIVENNEIKEIKEERHDIKKIIDSNENFIILGAKESGKTVLLDKILLEYSKSVKILHKICIYIDLNEVTQRIETAIAGFLGISVTKLVDFFSKYKVVLLVDNVSFENEYNRVTNKLDEFIDNYKEVKIIAASNETVEGKIPINIYKNYKNFGNFQILSIEGFRTKEIKELMKKWFHRNDFFSNTDKIDNLISFFRTLNIPTTPLSISMFLWLIEKQENYKPINKASMLKDFLNKMFDYEKEGMKTFYSEEFDRENNERLLSKLSFYMFENKMENYKLEYNKVLSIITDHLKVRKFDFEADSILKKFLIKGIFIKENISGQSYIRYRFNCFFEYFLMKQMKYDNKFKEYVLSEENYLKFLNEIDYFTGIERNNEELLSELLNRMEKKFNPIYEKLNKLDKKMDTIFEGFSNPVIKKIDENQLISQLKVKGKPSGQELENVSDGVLDSIDCENNIESKENTISDLLQLERTWIIPAIVLRNSDEIESENTKYNSYVRILKSSLVFCNLYKLLLEEYINKKSKEKKEVEEGLIQIRNILPLIHQIVMHTILGSNKLSIVIKEKIDNDFKGVDSKYNRGNIFRKMRKETELSDLEKYMSVFIYCDIKKDMAGLKYIGHLIKSVKNKYIYDMILFKLISYYYFRAKSKEEEIKYENLIADTVITAKHQNKEKKNNYMLNYRNSKKKHEEDLEK